MAAPDDTFFARNFLFSINTLFNFRSPDKFTKYDVQWKRIPYEMEYEVGINIHFAERSKKPLLKFLIMKNVMRNLKGDSLFKNKVKY